IDRFGDQVIAVNLDLVGRALTNRFPKCLKLPRRIDLLVELTSTALPLLFHELFNLAVLENLRHKGLEPRNLFRQIQGKVLVFRSETLSDSAIFVEEALGVQLIPDKGRLHIAQHLTSFRVWAGDLGELLTPDITNRYAGLDVLLLKTFRELLIRLISYHRQLSDRRISDTLTILVHRQPQPTTDGLPAFCLTTHLPKRTNLENIGIVPAFAKSRVRENETDWLIMAEQSSLILHDQVVRIIVFSGNSGGVAIDTLFNLREICTTQLRRFVGQ